MMNKLIPLPAWRNEMSNPETIFDELIHERLRQEYDEGFDRKHDDTHCKGELAKAAAGYADHAADVMANGEMANYDVPCDWPWADGWWKPKDPRRDLIRAGALIIAEIERIDRSSDEQV